MYTNATAIFPIMETLLAKSVPTGTTLAFCMIAVAASLPEFMMYVKTGSGISSAWHHLWLSVTGIFRRRMAVPFHLISI